MISVVIPAYNEHKAIAGTVAEVHTAMKQGGIENFEVVVVDDGSDDDTGRIAEGAGAKVVRNPHNVGYGHAIKRGVAAAKHDAIVITDADGTYPVKEIARLFEIYRGGFDMVVGARSGASYRESLLKRPLRLILRLLVEFAAGRDIPDINSGFRIFSRAAMQPYTNQLCDTFSFTTSLTLAFMMNGKFVTYMPIGYEGRIGRSKVRLWWDSLRTLQYIVQAILYYAPLKIFLLLAAVCVVISLANICVAYAFQLVTPAMLGVGSFLVGMLIFCLGLLADLLKQIMAK